jgi:hypothetical protein
MNPSKFNLTELYEADFSFQFEKTVHLLKTQAFHHLDLGHLTEELEGLGKRDKLYLCICEQAVLMKNDSQKPTLGKNSMEYRRSTFRGDGHI